MHVCTVRGAAVISTMNYIAEKLGESSLFRVIGEVGGPYRDVLDLDLLLSEHVDERVVVPIRMLVDIMQRAGELYLGDSGGAATLADRLGVYGAYESQPVLRRVIINLSSPKMLVRKASELWSHYYSCGRLEAWETGESSGGLSVEGLHDAHPLWCRRVTGYIREVLQRASGRQARVQEVRCATRGDARCEWEGDWAGPSLFRG